MTENQELADQFTAALAACKASLYSLAASFTADHEELVQSAICRVWKWYLRHPGKLESDIVKVLHTAVRNGFRSDYRKRRRSPFVQDSSSAEGVAMPIEEAEGPIPLEISDHANLFRLLSTALNRLKNKDQRRVLELVYLGGEHRTLRSVAQEMNITVDNARKLHLRGKEALKIALLNLAAEMNLGSRMLHP